MFERILVPLDGSTRAERAIPVAARIARITGGSVVLLRVAALPSEYEPTLDASHRSQLPFFAQHTLEEELAKAQTYLIGVAQSEKLAGMGTETAVLSGAAAQMILDAAKEKRVDLIVLCSHGETGFTRWAVGSVAQKIARYSPVPVLVLREGSLEAGDLQADAAHPLRALVALDGSPLAETALVPTAYLIAVLATPAQGALHLTQVVKLPTIHSERAYQQRDGEARKRAEDEAATYLSTITNIFGFAAVLGLQVTWSVTASEDVADALIRMAERGSGTGAAQVEGCSLIALTTHGRGGYQRWMMGSVTERVLDGTTLPLFLVRPQQEHIEAEHETDKTVPCLLEPSPKAIT